MQDVQTFMRLGVRPTMARTVWMLGFQRRRVRRCECEMLLPKPGPLPHTSQTEATGYSIGLLAENARGATRAHAQAAAVEGYPTRVPWREPVNRGRCHPSAIWARYCPSSTLSCPYDNRA